MPCLLGTPTTLPWLCLVAAVPGAACVGCQSAPLPPPAPFSQGSGLHKAVYHSRVLSTLVCLHVPTCRHAAVLLLRHDSCDADAPPVFRSCVCATVAANLTSCVCRWLWSLAFGFLYAKESGVMNRVRQEPVRVHDLASVVLETCGKSHLFCTRLRTPCFTVLLQHIGLNVFWCF